MPLGVLRAMQEIMKRCRNEDSVLFRLMHQPAVRIGLQSTKSLSSIVTDSAPASTAWATGSKTFNRYLAVLPDGRKLNTIFEILKASLNISCGIVTTTRVTHATPAAWISHNPNRDREDDIALDYLQFKPDIILGGGARHFAPDRRKDGKDLWQSFQQSGYLVLKNREQINQAFNHNGPILGTFSSSHLDYYLDRSNDPELQAQQPTLAEMTALALHNLAARRKGFILQVEAGRIDHANHSNDAWGAINETFEFDRTLQVILNFIQKNPQTLLIIASDHGNAGWGINGTGFEYNDATEALLFYSKIKASFAKIKKSFLSRSPEEIKDAFEYYTGVRLTLEEAEQIYIKTNEKRELQTGDFLYEPEATMAQILTKSIYRIGTENQNEYLALTSNYQLRRGNVSFTSTNHTAEDQLVLVYGHKAEATGINRLIENSDLFSIMLGYFNLKYKNPCLREEEAVAYLKKISALEWEKHRSLHIS